MDEEQRALERAVEADDSPATRLRLARHHARAGNTIAAFVTLVPARDDPAARAELLSLGSTPAPPRTAPRLKWRRAARATRLFAASPLGIVCAREAGEDRDVLHVLDPETGEERWTSDTVGLVNRDWYPTGAHLLGEKLLAWRERLVLYDLWTGRELGHGSSVNVASYAFAPGRFIALEKPNSIFVHSLYPPFKVL